MNVPRALFEFNKRKVTPVSFSKEYSMVTEANPKVASPQVNEPMEVEHSTPTFNPYIPYYIQKRTLILSLSLTKYKIQFLADLEEDILEAQDLVRQV